MKNRNNYFFLSSSVILLFLIPSSFLAAQSIDLTDPVKVANFVLLMIQSGDAEGMVQVMDPEQKKLYYPFTPGSRQELESMLEKDKEKVGKERQVSEIRECTTFSGKPGIAAKIRKKGEEVYVIILFKEGDSYYYDNLLTVTSKAYEELKLIKKVE